MVLERRRLDKLVAVFASGVVMMFICGIYWRHFQSERDELACRAFVLGLLSGAQVCDSGNCDNVLHAGLPLERLIQQPSTGQEAATHSLFLHACTDTHMAHLDRPQT